ncbi:MAG TPA: hypothetical protein VK119_11055, partial [Bacillota bacterium]|nr:hypothetical protein [Bacillota bacterium]
KVKETVNKAGKVATSAEEPLVSINPLAPVNSPGEIYERGIDVAHVYNTKHMTDKGFVMRQNRER